MKIKLLENWPKHTPTYLKNKSAMMRKWHRNNFLLILWQIEVECAYCASAPQSLTPSLFDFQNGRPLHLLHTLTIIFIQFQNCVLCKTRAFKIRLSFRPLFSTFEFRALRNGICQHEKFLNSRQTNAWKLPLSKQKLQDKTRIFNLNFQDYKIICKVKKILLK